MTKSKRFCDSKLYISTWLLLWCAVNYSLSVPIGGGGGSLVPYNLPKPSTVSRTSGTIFNIPPHPLNIRPVSIPDVPILQSPRDITSSDGSSMSWGNRPAARFSEILKASQAQPFAPRDLADSRRNVQTPKEHYDLPPPHSSQLNANGLYERRLLPDESSYLPMDTDKQESVNMKFTSHPVAADKIFDLMKTAPVTLGLISGQRAFNSFDNKQREINQNGGEAYFRLLKIERGDSFFYALEMIKEADVDYMRDVKAYWLPAHRDKIIPIEIPLVPGPNDPKYVFTEQFSGCSLAVDFVENPARLHLRHVYANQEDIQYNHDNIPNTQGMVDSMQPKDYFYRKTPDGNELNLRGFAMLHFSTESNQWLLRYQGILGYPSINNIDRSKKSENVDVDVLSKGIAISHVETKVLDVNDKSKPLIASIPISSSSTRDETTVRRMLRMQQQQQQQKQQRPIH